LVLRELDEPGRFEQLGLGHETTDAGIKSLARFTNLHELNIWSPKVTDAGMKAIARLGHLKRLHLMQCRVTDAGLSEIHNLKGLEEFVEHGTDVSAAGLRKLQVALPDCYLNSSNLEFRRMPR
jgi:internalin A